MKIGQEVKYKGRAGKVAEISPYGKGILIRVNNALVLVQERELV